MGFSLTTNPVLDKTVEAIMLREPDWDVLVPAFKGSERYRRGKYVLNNLSGIFAEMHVNHVLTDAHDVFDDDLAVFPIPDGGQAPPYSFSFGPFGRFHVYRSIDGNGLRESHTEMDSVVLAENLPVLFEVKLRHGTGYSTGKNSGTSKGITRGLRPDMVDHVLDPLSHYFGTNTLGYVMIVYPRNIHLKEQDERQYSPTQEDFVERGGLLVPFSQTRDKFLEEVETVARVHDL